MEDVVVEPDAEWWRAFRTGFASSGAILAAAMLIAGEPWTPATVLVLLVGAVGLALLVALTFAGRPGHPVRQATIRADGLTLTTAGGDREIPATAIFDLRPGVLVLEDGERVDLPAAVTARSTALYRSALLVRIRTEGRTYRHEIETTSWPRRIGRAYLVACAAAVLGVVAAVAVRAGGLGPLWAAGIGIAAWYATTRYLGARRLDLARAAGLATVTLDDAGVSVTERGGQTTRIPWSEVRYVSVPGSRGPVVVETDETDHVLPRAFHPSLARDLRAAWDAFAPAEDPLDEEAASPDRDA